MTLECGDGSCIAAAVSRDDWRFLYSGYRGTPENTRTVSLTVDVSLPMGYAGQGEKTAAYCAVEVRALDTAALDAALAAAAALQSKLVYNAAEAAGDAIYVTGDPNNPTDAADIPAGVKFVDNADGCADAFTAAAARADQAKVAGFASQQACNDRTEELRSAMETFRAAVQTGTGTNTDAYIRPLVEALLTLESNLDAPYHPDRQPLKAGTFHPLYHTGGVSLPGSDMRLDSVAWSAAGKGAPYVTIGADAADPDRYGAAIAQAPDAPQQVTFVAEAVCSNSRTGAATTLTFDYPAVIAAPLRVDADKSTREITLISGQENRFSAWLGFAGDGGDAIEGVNGRVQGVSGEFGTITSEATVESFNNALTGERYPVIRGGAFTVTPEALAAVYCTNEWQVPHETSALELSIAGDAVRVENGGSWYAPEGNLTHTVENVKVYHPAITYVITWMKTKAETAGEDSEVQVTLNTLYFGDYGLKMAFTREDTAPDGLPEDEVIYLDFGAEDAVENGAYGKDFVKTVTGKFVFDKQYWYWYKVDNGASGWVQGGATVYSSETWEG